MVNRLLDDRWRTEGEIRADAERLGQPLRRRHAVIAVLAGPSTKTADRDLQALAVQLGNELPASCLFERARWEPVPHVPGVVTLDTEEDWERLTRHDSIGSLERIAGRHEAIVVVSPLVDELATIASLYRDIEQNLRYVPAARTDAGALTARRLELFALIAGNGHDLGRLTRLVRQVFEPVERASNAGTLLGVIQAFCRASGNNRWGSVASALNIHRNTVTIHARKIEALTGLSFDSVADVNELVTVFRLREFARTELEKLDTAD